MQSAGGRVRFGGLPVPQTAAGRAGKTQGCRGCAAVMQGVGRADGRLPTAHRPPCVCGRWCGNDAWGQTHRRVLLRSTSCSCNVSTYCGAGLMMCTGVCDSKHT